LLNTTTTESQWLKLPAAAKVADVSVVTLRCEIHEGNLRAVKVGGRKLIRIHRQWIDEWLARTPVEVRTARR
jgi:excisionase family DNA binding protein